MTNITRRAFLALAIMALTPSPAQAIPRKYAKCPTVRQNGITYLLYRRCAIVTKTPNRATVTIPDSIKHDGKTYEVRSIWDATFGETPKIKKIVLKARHLESIEDAAIWERSDLTVICSDKSTYKWLKDTKAKARIKYRG